MIYIPGVSIFLSLSPLMQGRAEYRHKLLSFLLSISSITITDMYIFSIGTWSIGFFKGSKFITNHQIPLGFSTFILHKVYFYSHSNFLVIVQRY